MDTIIKQNTNVSIIPVKITQEIIQESNGVSYKIDSIDYQTITFVNSNTEYSK